VKFICGLKSARSLSQASPRKTLELLEFGYTNYKNELKNSGYRTYDSMDYEHMEELPENPKFIFDSSGQYFERYFGIDHLERKVEIPHQSNEELTTLVLGKNPTEENIAYVVAASRGMLNRVKAVKGNEHIKMPILYTSIKQHIEIIIPLNLAYFK